MKNRPTFQYLVSITMVAVLYLTPFAQYHMAAQGRNGEAQGNAHSGPCDQLPNPPGEAKGIEKLCPPAGSSSGIAKGDFNGDGFADLAVGVPDEDTGGVVDAGAVNVIYGSENGLTATSASVPAAQSSAEVNVHGCDRSENDQ